MITGSYPLQKIPSELNIHYVTVAYIYEYFLLPVEIVGRVKNFVIKSNGNITIIADEKMSLPEATK